MRTINKIIVHCSATSLDTTVESIRNYHVNSLGYNDIGYHFIITPDGICYNGRLITISGAHCQGYNYDSIGICLIGGKDMFDFTLHQLVSLKDLIKSLMFDYDISLDNIFSHYELNKKKACPRFSIKNLLLYENL